MLLVERLIVLLFNTYTMSWWHRDYKEQMAIQDIIDWLDVEIWYDQPTNYEWLDEEYYKSLERRMKVPKRVCDILIEYQDILHEIDCDVCGDATIKKWYFDEKKQKILSILQ